MRTNKDIPRECAVHSAVCSVFRLPVDLHCDGCAERNSARHHCHCLPCLEKVMSLWSLFEKSDMLCLKVVSIKPSELLSTRHTLESRCVFQLYSQTDCYRQRKRREACELTTLTFANPTYHRSSSEHISIERRVKPWRFFRYDKNDVSVTVGFSEEARIIVGHGFWRLNVVSPAEWSAFAGAGDAGFDAV